MIRIAILRCVAAVMVVGGMLAGAETQTTGAVQKKAGPPAAAARTSGRADIGMRSRDPYLGAIVVDADTGRVLFEDGADRPGYPASVIKLMDLLVIEDRIGAGQLSLSNRVTVTAEAARIGGSQVYLAEKEVFEVDDLLYALMVQSANDAATALAIHVGGTTAGFVELMNSRASALGMTNTHFFSCHGLPPAVGGRPDTSTARDLAVLARELVKHQDTLRYTSTRERGFRNDQFTLRTHNHLLGELPGCDGLKTGYFRAGGYSIVATAVRGGRRVIAVVLGSTQREGRDAQAKTLIARGFLELPPLPPPVVAPVAPVIARGMTNALKEAPPEIPAARKRTWRRWGVGVAAGAGCLALFAIVLALLARRFGRNSF